jgi:hypothetical protein
LKKTKLKHIYARPVEAVPCSAVGVGLYPLPRLFRISNTIKPIIRRPAIDAAIIMIGNQPNPLFGGAGASESTAAPASVD